MSAENLIRFTLVAPYIRAFSEFEPVHADVQDSRLFLFNSTEPTRTPSAILAKELIDYAMIGVFQGFIFDLEENFQDDEDGTRANLFRDAIAEANFDYRFSTKAQPNFWIDYASLLAKYKHLRAECPSSDAVELNVCLFQCDAARMLRKLLRSDDASVASRMSRISTTASHRSHESAKSGPPSPRLVSPTGNAVATTPRTQSASSPDPPVSMQTIKQQVQNIYKGFSDVMSTVRSSSSQAEKPSNEDASECDSDISTGTAGRL
jgi:hypothetical protein